MTVLLRHSSGSFYSDNDPGDYGYGPNASRRLSVTEDEARVLGALCRDKRVLEIGTGLGVSTRAIAEKASALVTVDPDPWVHANVWPTLGLPNHCLMSCPPTSGPPFDVVFVDGLHTKAALHADVRAGLALSHENTLFVLHDMGYPDLFAAAEELGKITVIKTTHGLGFMWANEITQ